MAKGETVPFTIKSKKDIKINTGQFIEIDGVKRKVTSIKNISFKLGKVEIMGMCR